MKVLIYAIIFLFFSTKLALSFRSSSDGVDIGSGGREDLSHLKAKNSNFKKGRDALKQALKLKNKNKIKKADKKFEKALKYFVLAYNEYSDSIEVISYLAFTYSEVGDLMMAEIYYQESLDIDPKNNSIHEKLGKLYFDTNRIDLAKERLKILKSWNCSEYLNLKSIIEKN